MTVKTARKIRFTSRVLFYLYVLAVVYLLFLSESLGRGSGLEEARYNLVPLREIRRFLKYRAQLGTAAVYANLAGNVLLFIPFGAILPVLHRNLRSLLKIMLLSALLSAVVETVQLLTRTGACDVDDILLNTLGGVLGYFVFAVCNVIRRKKYG